MIAELLFGGITHHYIGSTLNYCNVINKGTGTIKHAYSGVLVGSDDFRAGIIVGRDSACGKISGLLTSFKFTDKIHGIIGGYNTNYKEFSKRNIVPSQVFGITPVVGVDFKFPLVSTKDYKVSLDTLVAIGIITHGVSVKFEF